MSYDWSKPQEAGRFYDCLGHLKIEDLYQAFKKRYDREQQERKSKPCNSFPESWVCKSEKQIQLERQGCRFNGQELLDNHELDPEKPCQCGRPGR